MNYFPNDININININYHFDLNNYLNSQIALMNDNDTNIDELSDRDNIEFDFDVDEEDDWQSEFDITKNDFDDN